MGIQGACCPHGRALATCNICIPAASEWMELCEQKGEEGLYNHLRTWHSQAYTLGYANAHRMR